MKSKEELVNLTISLTGKIIDLYNPKIMALACNAASVSALSELREKFPDLPIVGTVPAIKPAVLSSKKRSIGVLGTRRTASDPYIAELVSRFGPDCAVNSLAAPGLVEFAEHRWVNAGKAERLETAKFYIDQFREQNDAVVLACTHFLFLKDDFLAAAGDDIKIFDSLEGITGRLEFLLDEDNSRLRSGSGSGQQVTMAVTGGGELEDYWEKLAGHFGITVERI